MPASSRIFELMLNLSAALRSRGVDHALIGGLALGPRGYPRGTTDVDFMIAEAGIPAVRQLMTERGATTIIEDDNFSSYFDGKIRADFQHALRPISNAMLSRAQPVAFDNTTIPVIQAEDPIGLKVQAYHNNHSRLKDRIDIQQLLTANWGKIDLQRIREYYALFGRENDLDGLLKLVSGNVG
jgi:predicted nucleotidyltransferase